VWNNGPGNGVSGGEVSGFFALPVWQKGLQITTGQGKKAALANRGVPDVSGDAPQRAPPDVGDTVQEHDQCTGVGRHCVVVEVAANDPPQPFPLLRDWLMHAPPHLLFDHLELRPHAVPSALPLKLELACSGFAADEGEAQEVEGLRFAEPTPPTAFRRKASELDQPGLLGMQCQREFP
jgi:hypothetical protein